uniref:RUN domain-containing protein n=1 Tax=Timema monikensis TaxID=170555 RepID=A0A7R9HUY1_9NEOP|nr:unnamed protein product [Timema monikensis]
MVFRITPVKLHVVALPFCACTSSALFNQLKGKLNLNVDDIDKLTTDDLRTQVDFAINQVDLVTVLYLLCWGVQGDGTPVELLKHKECTCTCPDHNISSSKAATSRNLQGRSEDETWYPFFSMPNTAKSIFLVLLQKLITLHNLIIVINCFRASLE